jgi:DNA-binding response OmpR family regulator
MRPLHLLLIEDDADSGDAMSILLRNHGVHVDWVQSGAEALDLYTRDPGRRADVILLDLMLPDMDGSTLIERLREITSVPPVIVHSASSQANIREAGREVGAVAVLRKPTDWTKLLAILERFRPADRPEEPRTRPMFPDRGGPRRFALGAVPRSSLR